jgi:SAM-dependent methyltransferase
VSLEIANQAIIDACPACSGQRIDDVLDLELPLFANVQWPDREQALRHPRGRVLLAECLECGHLFNRSFQPEHLEYGPHYENSLHHSKTFDGFAVAQARKLVEHFGLTGKRIVEIGCGGGDFLKILCREGGNTGFGFDVSLDPERQVESGGVDVTFYRQYFSARHAELAPDFLCCRHVLEHIPNPLQFLNETVGVLKQGRFGIYFEVPNAAYTISGPGIWDLIYEHCQYFTSTSLAHLFKRAGIIPDELYTTFTDQFLCLEATTDSSRCPIKPRTGGVENERAGPALKATWNERVLAWRQRLRNWRTEGRRVIVWGAGSKGVTFLNLADRDGAVQRVVDINPYKHGRYVSGTGQQIVGPEALREDPPDNVLVMNPVYSQEIAANLNAMGLNPMPIIQTPA